MTSWQMRIRWLLCAGMLASAGTLRADDWHNTRGQALSLYNAGRYAEALPLFDQALARKPHDIDLRNKRGNVYLRMNQPERALADFDEATRFSPFLAYDEGGFTRQFAPDVQREAGSQQYWGVQFYPSAFHNRGIANLMLGRDEAALTDFRHAIDLRRGFQSWTPAGRQSFATGQAASYGGIGQVHLSRGNPEQALDAFNEALHYNPNDANPYAGRGQALAMLGRLDDAMTDFDKALQLDPNHARARAFRADALGKLGRSDESLEDFDASLRADPGSIETRRKRAAHLLQLGKLDAALAELNAALALRPGDPGVLKDRGAVYSQKGDSARALADLDQALQAEPANARILQNRAGVLNALGRYDEAIRDTDAALRAEPKNAGALNNRGLALMALGQLDQAVIDLTAAIQSNPRLAPAYLNRGGAYILLGRHEDGAEDYASAVRLEPRLAQAYSNPSALPDLIQLRRNQPADDLALRQPVATPATPVSPAGMHCQQGDLKRIAGDWAGAVGDYTKAMEADPTFADALALRGWARLIAGERGAGDDARAWFARAGAGWRSPIAPSVALLAILAARHDGRTELATQWLAEAVANTKPDLWPAPIFAYLDRRLTPETLLERCRDNEQRTLAEAVIGYDLQLRGFRDASVSHLAWARDHGADRSIPRDLARQALLPSR